MDSGDLFSTVSRRLDDLVRRGRVRVENERQIWALVHQLARAAIVDQARLLKRMQRASADERFWSDRLASRLESGPPELAESVIERAFDALPSEVDRRILAMWLGEAGHAQIARETGLSHQAVRQRWSRIRRRLSTALTDDGGAHAGVPVRGGSA